MRISDWSSDVCSSDLITEAGGGSDVANLKTTAVRDGDHYIVNGGKMFITSGMRADWLTCAVRTGGPGAAGISLLLIDMNSPGATRTRPAKMGFRCREPAAIHFDRVRLPPKHMLRWGTGRLNRTLHKLNHKR